MDTRPFSGLRVLLGVSSSIAAHRAIDLASLLVKSGAAVRAVLTPNVPHLVGAAAFDAITGHRTITTLWGGDHAGEMDHLAATKWADVLVIAPATANTIGTLAHGLAPDALGTLALAWNKGPIIVAPAMNPAMWANAAVQANVATLRARGHRIVGPAAGRMACGDEGEGRLAPVEEIAAAVAAAARPAPSILAGRRVLITAGPTREYADLVRYISNPSTGRQGLALAAEAARRGARVHLVLGPTTLAVPPGIEIVDRVTTAEDMLAATMAGLGEAEVVVYSAAVSDWRPADRFPGKEKKAGQSEQTLRLERTPDIAATCAARKSPGQFFVGFAAETENLEQYARTKMVAKGFDLVFANPIGAEGAGFASETNRGVILGADGSRTEVPTAEKEVVASLLLDAVEARWTPRGA